MYNNTYWIYFSTAAFFILILIYNLYTVKKSTSFPTFLLNIGGFAMSIFDLVLGWKPLPLPLLLLLVLKFSLI